MGKRHSHGLCNFEAGMGGLQAVQSTRTCVHPLQFAGLLPPQFVHEVTLAESQLDHRESLKRPIYEPEANKASRYRLYAPGI